MPDSVPAPPERHRDDGLVRGIGTAGLAASIVNGVVGAGIFTLPAAVALEAGAAAPFAYLLCAVFMAAVVICFAEAGSRVPTSGGAYGTVEAAFGPAAGFVTGSLLVVSDVLASGGIAAAIADMTGTLAVPLSTQAGRTALIVCVYAGLSWANLVGVRRTAALIAGATAVKLVPLLLFLGAGLWAWRMAPPSGHAVPVSLGGFGRALILTFFAFEGMETALMASGEVRAPAKALPRALFGAMVFVLALYVGVQLSAQHLLGGRLPYEAAPLAEAAARVYAPLRGVMLAAAGVSMLAWLGSDVLGTSRMLFAFSRDGMLPAWLGRVHARSLVPANAVLAYAAAACVLAVTGSFLELIVLSSLAAIGVYALACAAALVLRWRGVAMAGTPLRVRGLPVAAALGLAGMAGLVLSAQWTEMAGLAAVILGSLGVYEGVRRVRGNEVK